MSDDMCRFMAKQNPKTCKSVIDKAKYGILSNELRLTFGEMAELWSENGLIKNTSGWKNTVRFFADEVRDGKLICENADVALGKRDPQKVSLESTYRLMGGKFSESIYYDPANAIVKKEVMFKYLRLNDGLLVIKSLLINKWFQGLYDKDNKINPLHAGSKTNLQRDKDAWELVEKNPELLTKTPGAIKKALQGILPRNSFQSGYEDWWGSQNIFPRTSKGGRPKSNP